MQARRRSLRRGRQRRSLLVLFGLALAASAGLAATGGAPRRGGAAPPRATGAPTRTPTTAATRPTTPTTTTVPATQTTTLPSVTTPVFRSEMLALFEGIRSGNVAVAARAFFPERAYLELKAISNPAADFQDRLMAEYRLDIAAAHALLGPDASSARFDTVTVAPEAAWISPGGCYNSIGYWHNPGARLLYYEGGAVHSIGIASLISWHGVWYVVHLGGVYRSSTVGLVDSPAVGAGVPAPPGGC